MNANAEWVALYRYQDAKGSAHVVDSLQDVPAALRAEAVRVSGAVPVEKRAPVEVASESIAIKGVELENAANNTLRQVEKTLHGNIWGGRISMSSLVLGAGLVVVVLLGWSAVRRRPGRIVKLLLAAIFAAGAGSFYLAWLRSMSGLPASTSSSPAAIVDHAKQTVDDVNRRAHKQQKILENIDTEQR